jgi:hypothetical protein
VAWYPNFTCFTGTKVQIVTQVKRLRELAFGGMHDVWAGSAEGRCLTACMTFLPTPSRLIAQGSSFAISRYLAFFLRANSFLSQSSFSSRQLIRHIQVPSLLLGVVMKCRVIVAELLLLIPQCRAYLVYRTFSVETLYSYQHPQTYWCVCVCVCVCVSKLALLVQKYRHCRLRRWGPAAGPG